MNDDQNPVVRVAGETDVEVAAALFRGYLDFYEVKVEDPDAPRAFLAERIRADESLVLLADVPGAGPGPSRGPARSGSRRSTGPSPRSPCGRCGS